MTCLGNSNVVICLCRYLIVSMNCWSG